MIMIVHLFSILSLKSSNALYNESRGGETGHQPGNLPLKDLLEGQGSRCRTTDNSLKRPFLRARSVESFLIINMRGCISFLFAKLLRLFFLFHK